MSIHNIPYFQQTTTEAEEDVTTTTTPSVAAPLPWYMKQGHRLPEPAPRGPSGRRLAQLWPAEDRGNDRIESQLMFVPPDPVPAGKLKKVLVEPGQRGLQSRTILSFYQHPT